MENKNVQKGGVPFHKTKVAKVMSDSTPFHKTKLSKAISDSTPFHKTKLSKAMSDSTPFHKTKLSKVISDSTPFHKTEIYSQLFQKGGDDISEKDSIQRMISKERRIFEKEDKKIQVQSDNNETASIRLNEKLSEMLDRLSKLMQKKGDNMRSRIYSRAQDTVLSEPGDITDINQMKGKPHIGPTILSKMDEYIKTGTLSVFEKEKDNPLTWMTDIHGIGPKKASELIEKGVRSIDDLREKQEDLLNNTQKIGLKYYEDTIKRIPRTEIDEYKKMFDKEFKKIAESDSQYEIVGSYRRGAKTSGDIDVIITSQNPDVFKKFVDSMKETGIILEILSYGNTKCLVIAKLKDSETARRVDFMYTPPDEYAFAILYFTGSKAFNTVMRGHALKMGISLNEHGVYKKDAGEKKGDKMSVDVRTEEDIFKLLNLKYKSPEERIDGRSIELINKEMTKKTEEKKEEKPKRKYTRKKKVDSKEKKEEKPKRKYTRKKKVEENKTIEVEEPIKLDVEELPELVPIITQKELSKEKPQSITKNTTKRKRVLKKDVNISKEMKEKQPAKNEKKINKEIAKQQMLDFKKDGVSVLEKLSETDLENMITVANEQYYNTKKPIATDAEYDIIVEYMERKYPNNLVLEGVGAKVEKNKVTLPYEMASMDKIKPDTGALQNWKTKYNGPYVLSCKLDGVSGLYTTEGETAKLYTRGDGKVGQDITHLLKVLKLPKEKGYVVRGEFIILKSVFDEKYKKTFANPRNLVSGIVNSKTIDEKAKDLHFIAYEVIKPELKPSEQMKKLEELGHKVVQNRLDENITNETLSETLIDWRTNYEYEIDGVIVTDDKIHIRKSGNPEHAFAFKMVISDQVAEAKVLDVIWTPSKSGYLKPRVRIEPIRLGGVTIEYATGFNGNFVETNKIGIGAVIELVRSGDVIPHIKSVTTPAEKAKMPDVSYHWTDTHVDIILDDVSLDETVQEKNITAFFTSLEVDGLSSGNVKRLMKAGYNTIPKILHMKKNDFEKVEGFKEKMINKIHDGIHSKIEKASLIEIMSASNMFGRGIGTKKITPIMKTYPNILTSKETQEEKKEMLVQIQGIGKENAKSFVENIENFMRFLEESKLTSKLIKKLENTISLKNEKVDDKEEKDINHPLYEKHVVMTKVRDKYIIEQLKKLGGIMDDNMGKNTDILITKSYEDVSNKTKKAKEMGIPIFTPADFVKKYNL
jgi:NAD-dependent DNA ligase/DNA polymerase/3'-5' exonuclease PolX